MLISKKWGVGFVLGSILSLLTGLSAETTLLLFLVFSLIGNAYEWFKK